MIIDQLFESPQQCPECGGISFSDLILAEKKDACYHKVKASAKVWPSAYASGRLVQCRKKGAANYGNKSEGVAEGMSGQVVFSGTGDNGSTYEIIQSGPTDFMIHANGKHIDTYGSLQRAMSVLKNEVPGLQQGMAEDDGFDVVSNYADMRSTEKGGKSNQTYTGTTIAKNPATGQQKSMASWDYTDPATGKNYSGSNYIDPQGNAEVQKNYEESQHQLDELDKKTVASWVRQQPQRIKGASGLSRTDFKKAKRLVDKSIPSAIAKYKDPSYGKQEPRLDEISLGDYGKKAPVSRAGAEIKKFFGRDDPAAVAAADRTIANRTKGLARADARRKPYTAPPVDQDKQRQQLTDKYPNIDQLVRRAEVNRDPNYEYADGQAYYDGQEAEQKYQRLKQIQRIIQGLSESKTLADYMDEAKGINSIRNPNDLQPLEAGGGMGGGGGRTTSGPSPFGAKPGSREASIAQNNSNTMTVRQGPNPDYVPPKTLQQKYDDLNKKLDQLPPAPPVKTPRPGRAAAEKRQTDQAQAAELKDVVPLSPAERDRLRPVDADKVRRSELNKEPPDLSNVRPGRDYKQPSNWDDVRPGLDEQSRKKQPPEEKYGPEYDDMVARVKKLAGLGPLKTVYDPKKRQYRNMPTAQQPKK
jgi:hypothetical protein